MFQGFLYQHLQSFEAGARLTPQTRMQQLHRYVLSLAGPATLVVEASGSGLSQAIDSPWRWGQGSPATASGPRTTWHTTASAAR